jgi:hypothetical protein
MRTNFFDKQLQDWPLPAKNYADLKHLRWKTISFDGFEVKIQLNPERLRSSAANVDSSSSGPRPCFLCPENRPLEQDGIDFPPCYQLLVNPYPIFSRHLTIPDNRHVPQRIEGRISDLLRLAGYLPDYTLLYNGPESGASAPDHFHFQAGNKGFLPVEQDIHSFPGKKLLRQDESGSIYFMENYLRSCFIYESKSEEWLISQFKRFTQQLHRIQPAENEPLLNMICWKEKDNLLLIVFPRKQHRPRQYYETGDGQILISPGIVDFCGVLVVPRKEDYDKINKELLTDIYSQLTLSDDATQNTCRCIVC